MSFKSSPKKTPKEVSDEFVSQARGETESREDTGKETRKKKYWTILMYEDILDRLKQYSKMEARRYETQTYIACEAIDEWLKKRGY